MHAPHALSEIDDIKRYVLGCKTNAIFTLVSIKTKIRVTYRFRRRQGADDFFFVDLFTGSDNEKDYSFIGTVGYNDGYWRFRYSGKSNIGSNHYAVLGVDWFVWKLNYTSNLNPTQCHFYHSGVCSRCGRVLTVPESLEQGMGPVCREKAIKLLGD